MKKYLFGLGAMLVGAGLMFVLMHGEVSAEDTKPRDTSDFLCGTTLLFDWDNKKQKYIEFSKKYTGTGIQHLLKNVSKKTQEKTRLATY